MSKLDHCFLCGQKFFLGKWVSINECMQEDSTPGPTLYQFMQSISNFKELNIKHIPETVCLICYQAAELSIKFQTICNKSAGKLRIYLEEAKKVPIVTTGKDRVVLGSQDSPSENQESDENQQSIGIHGSTENEKAKKIENDSDDSLSDFTEECFRRLDNPPREEMICDNMARNSEKVECKVCDEIYIQRDKFKHYKTHVAPFICKICSKSYSTELGIKEHKKTHETAKYLCSFCGMIVRTKMSLRNHILRHTNEKPFACEVCGLRFRCKTQHNVHITIHTSEKPYLCTVCAKVFRLEKSLSRHMLVHTKVKPVQCKFCGSKFTRNQALQYHLDKSCRGYWVDDEVEAGNKNEEDANKSASMVDDNMDS